MTVGTLIRMLRQYSPETAIKVTTKMPDGYMVQPLFSISHFAPHGQEPAEIELNGITSREYREVYGEDPATP